MKRFSNLFLLLALPLFAEWFNPVPVAVSPENLTIQDVIADGEGGAVVMYSDDGDDRFYMQRIDSSGNVMWYPNGVAVFDVSDDVELRYPDFLRDENGNYWVAVTCYLEDYNHEADIYLQKISPLGERMFDNRGIAVCYAERNQTSPCLCPSGDGVIVGWRDLRDYDSDGSIVGYAQRVEGDGSIKWETNGVEIYTTSLCYKLACCTDQHNGAFFIYNTKNREGETIRRLFFQHLDSLGSRLWEDTGKFYNLKLYSGLMEPDGNGGFIFDYYDYPNRFQRIDSLGNPLWDSAVTIEGLPSPLGSNGVYVSDTWWVSNGKWGGWEEVKVSYFNLDDRIITSTVVWDEAIQEDDVCDDGYLHTSITENGIVVWRDCYATDYGILAQRVDTSGVVLWDSSNSPVSFCLFICGPSGDKPFVAATPDDGAIVIWEDNRNGTADIYATKIDADGSLPPGISEQPISVTQPSFRVVTNVGRQILLSSSSNQVLTLDIFDASGRLVDEVRCSASSGVVEWGSDHGPGVYFIKPPSNESSAQKVILIR